MITRRSGISNELYTQNTDEEFGREILKKSLWKLFISNLVFMKKALVTGITGQDGAYLAELLLSK